MNRNDPSCCCVPQETKASTASATLAGIFAFCVLMNMNDPICCCCCCVPQKTKKSTASATLAGIFALGVLALGPWAIQQ
jgi:hypothetical protein